MLYKLDLDKHNLNLRQENLMRKIYPYAQKYKMLHKMTNLERIPICRILLSINLMTSADTTRLHLRKLLSLFCLKT